MGIDARIDRRTNGYRSRAAAMMQKPDAAIALIRNALNAGVPANYLLIDTWFTTEPFIKRVLDEGLDIIGMVKDSKQQYKYKGRFYGLRDLAKFVRFDTRSDIFGSLLVCTKYSNIPVKLVFVRNRNKKNEFIVILSTECSLADEEIVRTYGSRWSIECCFKVCKSLLKLGREYHGVSYDLTVSTTAIVFTRYILLEWIRRTDNDPRTMGSLFFQIYDEVKDIELADALRSLLVLFVTGMKSGAVKIDETIRVQLISWFMSQPTFIRVIFPAFLTESGLLATEYTNLGIPCQ